MASSTPSYLRLYHESRPESSGKLGDFWPGLDKLCRAFEQVTGWPLQCLPDAAPADAEAEMLWSADAEHEATDSEQVRVGVAAVEGAASPQPPVDLGAAVDLAATIGQLLGDLAQARQGLWKREAELAAGVPLSSRRNEPHLAHRLQASLRAAAQSVGGRAAALYLVDETTTYLKLRSTWGLPPERLLLPPRELARAAADLEALLGHAIALEDTAAQAAFQPPEDCAAAVCVPVSSAAVPLGTLWIFGDQPRPFSDRDVNLIEIVAGRIAVELEREMLLAAGADAGQFKRQLSSAERWQDRHLPHVSPLNDTWEIAGWTQAAGELSGEYYDWFVRADEMIAVSLGNSRQEAIEAALSITALRASARAHAQYSDDPAAALSRVNEALWSGSPGDQASALFLAFADPHSSWLRLAAAGDLSVWSISAAGIEPLASPAPAVGVNPESVYAPRDVTFSRGQLLVVLSEGATRTLARAARHSGDEDLPTLLAEHRDLGAKALIELIHDRLTALAEEGPLSDCTALVVKRR